MRAERPPRPTLRQVPAGQPGRRRAVGSRSLSGGALPARSAGLGLPGTVRRSHPAFAVNAFPGRGECPDPDGLAHAAGDVLRMGGGGGREQRGDNKRKGREAMHGTFRSSVPYGTRQTDVSRLRAGHGSIVELPGHGCNRLLIGRHPLSSFWRRALRYCFFRQSSYDMDGCGKQHFGLERLTSGWIWWRKINISYTAPQIPRESRVIPSAIFSAVS